jgi:hypothetical protein
MVHLKKLFFPGAVFLFFLPLAVNAELTVELPGTLETLHAQPFSQDRGLTDSLTISEEPVFLPGNLCRL